MRLTVAVATFGDDAWRQLAETRALPSARAQHVPVLHVHHPAGTLATARNEALNSCFTDRIVFLDADDELEPGFVDQVRAAPDADLLAPAVRYVTARGTVRAPRVPRVAGHHHACTAECLLDGNWLVIGTVARTGMLRRVGGFREWGMYEDWCLWLRCRVWEGASVLAVPGAVYRAHVRAGSRNRSPSVVEKNRVHREIAGLVAAGGRVGVR